MKLFGTANYRLSVGDRDLQRLIDSTDPAKVGRLISSENKHTKWYARFDANGEDKFGATNENYNLIRYYLDDLEGKKKEKFLPVYQILCDTSKDFDEAVMTRKVISTLYSRACEWMKSNVGVKGAIFVNKSGYFRDDYDLIIEYLVWRLHDDMEESEQNSTLDDLRRVREARIYYDYSPSTSASDEDMLLTSVRMKDLIDKAETWKYGDEIPSYEDEVWVDGYFVESKITDKRIGGSAPINEDKIEHYLDTSNSHPFSLRAINANPQYISGLTSDYLRSLLRYRSFEYIRILVRNIRDVVKDDREKKEIIEKIISVQPHPTILFKEYDKHNAGILETTEPEKTFLLPFYHRVERMKDVIKEEPSIIAIMSPFVFILSLCLLYFIPIIFFISIGVIAGGSALVEYMNPINEKKRRLSYHNRDENFTYKLSKGFSLDFDVQKSSLKKLYKTAKASYRMDTVVRSIEPPKKDLTTDRKLASEKDYASQTQSNSQTVDANSVNNKNASAQQTESVIPGFDPQSKFNASSQDLKDAYSRIASYEMDPWKAISYPAFNDVSIEEVSTMLKQLRKAQRAQKDLGYLSETKEGLGYYGGTVNDFVDAVDELWVDIKSAEKKAKRLAWDKYTESEQRDFHLAKSLLGQIEDNGNTEEARLTYYAQLKRVVNRLNAKNDDTVPAKILAEIENSSRLELESAN